MNYASDVPCFVFVWIVIFFGQSGRCQVIFEQNTLGPNVTWLDNYMWIMSNIWRIPTYPPDWPKDKPTTEFVVPVAENPYTPKRIMRMRREFIPEIEALEAKAEEYRALCEKDKHDIDFINRTRYSLDEAGEYFTFLKQVRQLIKKEDEKFRNGTYLLREVRDVRAEVRSNIVLIGLAKKEELAKLPEFAFQQRKTEYHDLVQIEIAVKRIRQQHKLRLQLLKKYHKYYLKHYKPTSTRGPIPYKYLPFGLKELVEQGKFNITGIIRPNFWTRRIRSSTDIMELFRNITTKKPKRLTGPELEEAMKGWNKFTPAIYYRKYKTTTPFSVSVAIKRELNRRKYERYMKNLKIRIQKGETTRKIKRYMQRFPKGTPVRKRHTPKVNKEKIKQEEEY